MVVAIAMLVNIGLSRFVRRMNFFLSFHFFSGDFFLFIFILVFVLMSKKRISKITVFDNRCIMVPELINLFIFMYIHSIGEILNTFAMSLITYREGKKLYYHNIQIC